MTREKVSERERAMTLRWVSDLDAEVRKAIIARDAISDMWSHEYNVAYARANEACKRHARALKAAYERGVLPVPYWL